MGTGIGYSFVGACALAFLAIAHARAMKMKEQSRFAEEYFWYAGGLIPLALASIFLAANGDFPMIPQRILMFSIGALLGGSLLLGIGEIIRPMPANSQTPSSPVPPQQNIYGGGNVFSYGQSGGITAGTVNVGPIPRSLNQPRMESLKKQIQDQVPKDKPIIVTALLGDSEAVNFAYELQSYLKNNGYKLKEDSIDQSVFTASVKGIILRDDGETRTFIVGANLP